MHAPITNMWSGYSLLQSTLEVGEIPAVLRARGFKMALLADFETLAGLEEFDGRMRDAGLFPLLGVSRVVSFLGENHMVRIVARSSSGWKSLIRFSEWDFGTLLDDTWLVIEASDTAWWQHADFQARFPDGVVVELKADQRAWLGWLPSAWSWVPAACIRFLDPDDQEAYQTLAKIGGLTPARDAKALPQNVQGYGMGYETWPEDALWLPEVGESVLPERSFKMPNMDRWGKNLRQLSEQGLIERCGNPVAHKALERLHYELEVIERLGFAGYFLMVHDVVAWAKSVGIRVGPGRGSAAGSLVSYALHITEVNPLDYGLIFERFLNPDRYSLPDIDLDFEDERRHEVIHYLRERHGTDRVAQIGTYGTLGARAVLRDVARVIGIPNDTVTAVLSSVEWQVNDRLKNHLESLRRSLRQRGISEQWLGLAEKLEGLPRHRSIHAAGVIISPYPLADWIYCHGDIESGFVTDFEMAQIEHLGFVKLDVLGLRTLGIVSHIEKALDLSPHMMEKVDGQDRKTLALLGRADTDGVFQLDGRGVKNLLRQMRPRSRQEIMAVVALYRPGPMDAISTYLERRRQGFFPKEPLDELLVDTYGVFIYQEQLMSAVQQIAGFSMAEADLIRRAISKKDHELLAKEGERVIRNMRQKGYTGGQADVFWEKLRAFGDYGFNKSHATAYGLLSYYLAYLKAHYPEHFWAALLSHVESSDRLRTLLVQAQSQGADVHFPHVNESRIDFSVKNGVLYAGLSLIRGLGQGEAQAIWDARKIGGRFSNLSEFEARLGRKIPSRALDALYQAGALLGLGDRIKTSQMSLFEGAEASRESPEVAIHPESAMGFSWPTADGPIFVRLDESVPREEVAEAIVRLGEKFPGPYPVNIIYDGKKVHRMREMTLDGHMLTIQALKELPGVQAAGRHVSE